MSDDVSAIRVRLHGAEYLLIGGLVAGGAIAIAEDFRAGRASFAHLCPDGRVMRFNEVIAGRDDLEVLGEVEVAFDPLELLLGCFTDPSWERRESGDA